MLPAPLPSNEAARRLLLQELELLDGSSDPVLDGLVRSASVLTHSPIALVSLVDEDRQVFKARVGLDADSTPRSAAFCAHTILGSGLLEVPDAREDPRFADNPLVTGQPFIRFYAGAPVGVGDLQLGTLCVLDHEPRRLDDAQRSALADLARAVSHWLEHRHNRLALRESQIRLADIIQAASDWLWEADPAGRLTWRSEGMTGALGLGDDASDANIGHLDLLDDLGEALEPPRRLYHLLQHPARFRLAVVARAGGTSVQHFNVSAVPKFDDEHRLIGWRGVLKDISEVVRERRRAAERWLPLPKLAALLPGLIYQYRQWPDGHDAFPYASDGIETIYELRPLDVRHDARQVFDRLHPDDAPSVARSIAQSAEQLTPWRQEYRVVLPQAGVRWLEGHATPERLADGGCLWHGFITDVTERREIEALRRAKQAAERANEAKTAFLSRASHELRTPLNAIIGFTQLMQADADLPEHTREQLGFVRHAGASLLGLVNDMLDLAGAEQGQRPLRREAVDAHDVVRHSLKLIEPLAAERAVDLADAVVSPGLRVQGDERALGQVLLNLLSNAVKYNRSGGAVHLRAVRRGGRALLSVEDTGPGMSSDQLARLFEPFNRLGAEYSGIPGSGLGLVISRQLVESMGGSLNVLSQAGRGSRFIVKLPLADEETGLSTPATASAISTPLRRQPPADATRPLSVAQADGLPVERPRAPADVVLLYVEDDPVSGLLLQAALEDLIVVHVARSLEAARLWLRTVTPALIVSDMNLPDGNGLDLLHGLAEDPRLQDVTCIALSADAMPPQVKAALEGGFEDYWFKPLDIRAVRDQVAGLLRVALSR
jgi:signal transduction histidine kinase